MESMELFSADGYSLGWTRYQEMMITRLNELVAGRSFADRDVKELAIRFAHNPMTASTFNHASMAHNNHFFYQQFSGTPRRLEDYPELGNSLVNQFGSITTLRKTFLDTAANMFGPGFVWLVWARDPQDSGFKSGSWKVLCTYNAGSPYPEAGFMQQGLDMNTNNAQSFQQYKSSMIMGYMGNNSELARERAKLPPGGTTVMPVLCVSVWEHTYIYDFGIGARIIISMISGMSLIGMSSQTERRRNQELQIWTSQLLVRQLDSKNWCRGSVQ
ncbi:hypothetical protein MRB53_037781 [Persea americana]|nr:hypothetical protein MRB53_037781 [Persea americana]